jgi:hypothetical protein
MPSFRLLMTSDVRSLLQDHPGINRLRAAVASLFEALGFGCPSGKAAMHLHHRTGGAAASSPEVREAAPLLRQIVRWLDMEELRLKVVPHTAIFPTPPTPIIIIKESTFFGPRSSTEP